MRFAFCGWYAVKKDATGGGLIHTGDHVEHGCFARAIWPDQAEERLLPHSEFQFGNCRQPAEPDGCSLELEESWRHHFTATVFRPNANNPCGRAIIKEMISSE